MKRILVADDELPVIEGISLMVRRNLSSEFEIVGSAFSGRDAIEKAATLKPDIVLMDVKMPGISGLDAIREIRKRGFASAFVLITAYERFDIAREAVELGVSDYLLKPISRDQLAQSLREAALTIDHRGELASKEIEHQEREESMRRFVEAAFLHGIMLGEHFGADLTVYRTVLGISAPYALTAVAAFLPTPGTTEPDLETHALHNRFRNTVRYKTTILVGPLVANHALLFMQLRESASAPNAVQTLQEIITLAYANELTSGYLKLGFGKPKPLAKISASWSEAMADLLGSKDETNSTIPRISEDKPFEDDESFLEGLSAGAPERARLFLERIVRALGDISPIPLAERYRIISLFSSAYRLLVRREWLEKADAYSMMDFEDLRTVGNRPAFDLAVQARFAALIGAMKRTPHWSPTISRAVAFIKENYGNQISLETAAYSVGLSPNRLSRLFCEEMKKGFSDYLIEFRIEKAKELLSKPGASIKQVSISCGYPDPNYFSRLFKKVTGLTPTAFSCEAMETEVTATVDTVNTVDTIETTYEKS